MAGALLSFLRFVRSQPILQRLREKAHCAFTAAQNEPTGNAMYEGALWNIKTENDEDELDIFAGRTAVVASKRPSPSPSTHLPPLRQNGDGLPLITPPSTIPIAPISAGGANGVSLTDAWPSVHPQQSSSSGPAHSHSHSHMATGQYSSHPHSQSNQPTLPALHAPQQPYRLSFSQPAQPPPPQSQSSYQWVPGHSHSHSASGLSAPSQNYSQHGAHFGAPSQPPSFPGADILQRYAGPGYPQQQQQQQQPGGQHQPYAPPSELVNLGLASRHGRLDERWTSFMHENGFL